METLSGRSVRFAIALPNPKAAQGLAEPPHLIEEREGVFLEFGVDTFQGAGIASVALIEEPATGQVHPVPLGRFQFQAQTWTVEQAKAEDARAKGTPKE